MLRSAIKLKEAKELCGKKPGKYISVTLTDGLLKALSWPYNCEGFDQLRKMAKRRGGVWDRDIRGWTFNDSATAHSLLAAICKKNPDWPVIGDPDNTPKAFERVKFSHLKMKNDLEACIIKLPIPGFADFSALDRVFHIFQVSYAKGKGKQPEELALLLGSTADIAAVIESITAQGAARDHTLAATFAANGKLKVTVTGWAVQIICDLQNPLHYLAGPVQKYEYDAPYPNGKWIAVPWDGVLHITRKLWPGIKNKLQKIGLEWEGDDPGAELTIPSSFDEGRVAGWDAPAPNGYLLHAYQKIGAQFCASRGMRALIGDEMGVGKTVQAIAAAEACNIQRVLVICPANARYVWEREIQGWGGRGEIQHITNQLDKLDTSSRWHIVTYDLIAARKEIWRLNDEQEENALLGSYPSLAKKIKKEPGEGYPRKVALAESLPTVPPFTDPKRIAQWEKTMQRLRGELLEQFLAAGQMLVILDEAHRAKNKNAKRTKAIQRLAAGETQMLLLTGTPLRNNEHEAAVLLGLLDGEAAAALSNDRGYTIQDVKDYLNYFMLRRTKAEVLPELPEKIRQRIDISDLDPDQMEVYTAALEWARESYYRERARGASEKQARQSMQGGIEQARTALGSAKVRGGAVADLVLEVLENKGCCVVFCAHHQVSDELKAQLEKEKRRVAVVDGRMSQKDRAATVNAFQEGRLDVFIGGINAAGEAITLTRADTVIFVELDWVPAALLQAEDRIHRVGQRSNCQVIQLTARLPIGEENLDEIMVDLVGSKIARIGAVLDEDGTNIIAGSIQTELHGRLLSKTKTAAVGISKADTKNVRRQDTPKSTSTLTKDAKAPASSTIPQAKPQGLATRAEKRKRGRPKIYVDDAVPTATERSKRSIQALAESGGKRLMLRLTPEANEALRVIMTFFKNAETATATINQVLIDRKNELILRASS
jgi:superfamily II DNA or RNA helicase